MKRNSRLLSHRTISILKCGKVYMSYDLREIIKKFKAIEVLVDLDYGKLALKPTNDLERGYALSNIGSNIHKKICIQASCLKNAGIHGHFKARFTEGKIILDGVDITEFKEMEFLED